MVKPHHVSELVRQHPLVVAAMHFVTGQRMNRHGSPRDGVVGLGSIRSTSSNHLLAFFKVEGIVGSGCDASCYLVLAELAAPFLCHRLLEPLLESRVGPLS